MKDLRFRFREIEYVVKITQFPVADMGDDEDHDIYYNADVYDNYNFRGCVEYITDNKIQDFEYLISECKKSIINHQEALAEAEEDIKKLGYCR